MRAGFLNDIAHRRSRFKLSVAAVGSELQLMWKKVGIESEVVAMEQVQLIRAGAVKDYQAMPYRWAGGVDPDKNVYWFFHSNGSANRTSYSNPEMDKLTAALSVEFDTAKQIELQKEIDKLLWSDFYGVTIFQFPSVTAFDPNAIKGIAPSTLAPTIFWNIWDWEPVTAATE